MKTISTFLTDHDSYVLGMLIFNTLNSKIKFGLALLYNVSLNIQFVGQV